MSGQWFGGYRVLPMASAPSPTRVFSHQLKQSVAPRTAPRGNNDERTGEADMSNYDYACWGGPDGRCGVHKVPYVYLDGVPESGRECAASWVMRALRAELRLTTTRDALHTAFAIIANAQNCLGDGDPTLGPQWHEAAQRFMDDYNRHLDVYTGPLDGER